MSAIVTRGRTAIASDADWCLVCCTQHSEKETCPGEIRATGPEEKVWRVSVETPQGTLGYGVLLAPTYERWRARILTFPRMLWTLPGGRGTFKFVGPTPEDAKAQAIRFVREYCEMRCFEMRDAPAAAAPNVVSETAAEGDAGFPRAPRYDRRLPVRFGVGRPVHPGKTRNLSETGLFVQTREPYDPGGSIGLMLELEHCKVPLRAAVIWARRNPQIGKLPGMGLRLLNPPHVYKRYVEALG